MGMIVAALVIVLLGFGAYYLWRSGDEGVVPPGESSVATSTSPQLDQPAGPASTDVSFETSDGVTLAGTYSVPMAGSPIKMPALILVHRSGVDRHEFDPIISTLLDQGYAVLAYDSRGLGKSEGTAADTKSYMKDFSAAVAFLGTQTEVDASEIGVIGSSLGAHVALVAAGTIPEVKAAVLLSPSVATGLPKELLGTGIAGFKPDAVFVASNDTEKAAADAIFKKAQQPKQQRVYGGTLSGVGLLEDDKARQDLLSFISQYLDVKG